MLSNLFKDMKTRHPIYDLTLPFSDYINQCRKIIAATRQDLTNNREKIIDANSPFEFQPENTAKKSGVLLIHGLLDSPFIMRDIGRHLQKQGYFVRAILLPGHGTVPGDLLNIDYQDWLQAVTYGVASFSNEVEAIHLIGMSTGANLALHHVLHHKNIASTVLLSPAIKIRSRLDFSSNWHHTISWAWERAKWLDISPENDFAKYQSLPFNAAYQVYCLARIIKKLSRTHTCHSPLFYALSLADSTVCARATIKYFHRHFNAHNRMLLYTSGTAHQHAQNITVRSSIYPNMHIRELSHIALPVSPDNSHYGINGDYINASRIDENNHQIVYGAMNKLQHRVHTLLYKAKLTNIQRKRLTFNPDFDYMMHEIENFIDKSRL